MTTSVDDIASAWISEHKNYPEQKDKKIGWAYLELNRLCKTDPEMALEVIEDICKKDNSDSIMEVLAAGPLENLLGMQGDKIANRIVNLAEKNAVFRELLGGVWRGNMNDAVWERIKAVRSRTW